MERGLKRVVIDDFWRDTNMEPKESISRRTLVLSVVLFIVIICTIAGVVFYITELTRETSFPIDSPQLFCTADPDTDTILLKVLKGSVRWSDYKVSGNDIQLNTTSVTTGKGEVAIFTGLELHPGQNIEVKLLDLEDERYVFWISNIIC